MNEWVIIGRQIWWSDIVFKFSWISANVKHNNWSIHFVVLNFYIFCLLYKKECKYLSLMWFWCHWIYTNFVEKGKLQINNKFDLKKTQFNTANVPLQMHFQRYTYQTNSIFFCFGILYVTFDKVIFDLSKIY